MRHKTLAGLLAVVLGFLVITNPVVAEAAKQITGKQIKNGSITSADIKNNSIKSKDIKNNQVKSQDIKDGQVRSDDLASGVLPEVRGFGKANVGSVNSSNDRAFVGDRTVVTVGADDVLVGAATLRFESPNAGDDIDYSICYLPARMIGVPVVLGGPGAEMVHIDVGQNQDTMSTHVIASLPAGTYQVGMCLRSVPGNMVLFNVGAVGWLQVHRGVGSVPDMARQAARVAD